MTYTIGVGRAWGIRPMRADVAESCESVSHRPGTGLFDTDDVRAGQRGAYTHETCCLRMSLGGNRLAAVVFCQPATRCSRPVYVAQQATAGNSLALPRMVLPPTCPIHFWASR